MSKNVLFSVFSIIILLSLLLFFKRNPSFFGENFQSTSTSYIEIKKFKYYQYYKDKVHRFLQANVGELTTVNHIRLYGELSGWRHDGQQSEKEELQAGFVSANLNTKQIEDLKNSISVLDAFFGESVSIKKKGIQISTQEAYYMASGKNRLLGKKPVRAVLESQFIHAENGFRLDLDQEDLELIGPVRGVIDPDAKF